MIQTPVGNVDLSRQGPIVKRSRACISFAVALLTIAFQARSNAQTPAAVQERFGLPAQYSATAFGQGGAATGKNFGMTIYVTDLTDDEQTKQLGNILMLKGQDGLVKAFSDIKDKGRIAPTGSVGTGVRFVRIHPTKDGGQHIVMVTDRPISFPELYNGTRSTEYKFGIVSLDVDKDGKGTGKFAPLCKIRFNKKNELEIENYGQKPFRLANVYRQK
jgi:hypothetical protein